MGKFRDKLAHAWNAFSRPEQLSQFDYGSTSFESRPYAPHTTYTSERSIISSILARISMDVAAVELRHVRLDKDGRYQEDIVSGLNDCLSVEANIDQAATAFRQDIAMTMFDDGVAVVVPVDTTINPRLSGGFDINTMRVGEVVAWHPRHVRTRVYNDDPETGGKRDEITIEKKTAAIVVNPLHAVMNEPSSTLKRLVRKLMLLDQVDEATSSGKLDLIIQLPYVVKSEARRTQAKQRREEIEFQLKGSQYGIAYTDGTEKITQLNRPAENNLLTQIQYLQEALYAELGLTKEIMNGTADEAAMLNYFNRTVLPVVIAIVEAMRRSFLTKTARTQGQSVMWFTDPFKFMTMKDFADVADKLSRNEIASSNELRQVIHLKPSKDPKADQLINSNMPAPSEPVNPTQGGDGQNDSNRTAAA